MLDIVNGSILNVSLGVIAHQVNCRNVMGAGVAKAISERYPLVKKRYHEAFANTDPEDLFGAAQEVVTREGVVVVNLFTQKNYGNSSRTGEVYTDEDKLVEALERTASQRGRVVHIPYGIECGLAGGDWGSLARRLNESKYSFIAHRI